MFHNLVVIDEDFRRRAAMAHSLSSILHVDPIECESDLSVAWPDERSVILAHDTGEVAQNLFRMMDQRASWIPVVLYAENPAAERVSSAVQAGAASYLELSLDPEQVYRSIEECLRTNEREFARRRRRARARSLVANLSPREAQIAAELAQGASNKEIAKALKISPRTVEIHRAHVLQKLQTNSSAAAIRVMIEAT